MGVRRAPGSCVRRPTPDAERQISLVGLYSSIQARRNLSDHARLLASFPSEEGDPTGNDPTSNEEYGGGFTPTQGEEASWGGGGGHADRMTVEGQARENALGPASDCEGFPTPFGATQTGTGGVELPSGNSNGSISSSNRGGKSRGKGKRGPGGDSGTQRAVKRRDHWANQLCTPEWMLTVPSDLNGARSSVGAGWYVMARPEGKRVLVISSKGETVARQMSGTVIHRFSSHLPGGSSAGRRGGTKGGGYCILDCVFHELDQTFFVLDMMAWKGYPLYDCNTDFRFYWVRTKLLEADGPLETVSPSNAFRIKSTPYHECDRQGLAHAYSSPVPFIKDGLLFYFKAAHYQLGPTPLVLLWKDGSVARYLGTESAQAVVLRVGGSSDKEDAEERKKERTQGGGDGNPTVSKTFDTRAEAFGRDKCRGAASPSLLTCDGVCLAEVGPEGSPTYIPQAKPNDLLRFTLTGAEEELVHQSERSMAGEDQSEGSMAGEDQSEGGMAAGLRGVVHGLRFDKPCSKLRPMADSWSKVLFQARLRRNCGVSINDIDAKSIGPDSSSGSGINADVVTGSVEDEDDML
eukprot:jgi/Undpi1/7082/HiC_scaffold_22.g09556.m1